MISRGNYLAGVFRGERTRAAFLKCLDEACRKAGWVVHAWAVMSNHYHLKPIQKGQTLHCALVVATGG